jgi:hypothetical protein
VQAGDLGWLLDHARTSEGEAEKRAWARIVDMAFRGQPSFEDADALLAACEADDVIRSNVPGVFGSVALDSPEAEAGRARLARDRKFARGP